MFSNNINQNIIFCGLFVNDNCVLNVLLHYYFKRRVLYTPDSSIIILHIHCMNEATLILQSLSVLRMIRLILLIEFTATCTVISSLENKPLYHVQVLHQLC